MIVDRIKIKDNIGSTIDIKLSETYIEFECEHIVEPYSGVEDSCFELYIDRSDKKTLTNIINILQKAIEN